MLDFAIPTPAQLAAHRAALARTAARYRGGDRFSRHYVASKLRRDPVHLAVLAAAQRAPFGRVLDLGCGRGQLAIALLEAGLATHVLGLDRAGASLNAARIAANGLALELRAADLAAPQDLPRSDTVLLIDVLYLLSPMARDALLDRALAAAGQRLLVRTLDPERGWRSRVALLLERIGQPFWPHSGDTVAPPALATLRARIEAAGFGTDVVPCWEGTPFANVLLRAERRRDPSSA